MRRTLFVVTGLIVLLAAACGQQPSVTPTASPTATATGEPGPTATPTPEPTDPGTPSGAEEVEVFLARADDSGIWAEPVVVELDEPTVAVARAAMTALVTGTATGGADPALATQVPEGTELLDVAVTGEGVLVVDLSAGVRDGSAAGSGAEAAFAQQLAHTGAQFPTVDTVRLRVEGEDITELWGHVDWSEPIEPDPFALSPITFTSHRYGEAVEVGEVTVGGLATVFEATFDIELVAPDGSVVERTFVMADAGGPARGDWQHTVRLTEPGTWTVRALEQDMSGGEGRPPFVTALALEAG